MAVVSDPDFNFQQSINSMYMVQICCSFNGLIQGTSLLVFDLLLLFHCSQIFGMYF